MLFESFRSFKRVRIVLPLENLILDIFQRLNSQRRAWISTFCPVRSNLCQFSEVNCMIRSSKSPPHHWSRCIIGYQIHLLNVQETCAWHLDHAAGKERGFLCTRCHTIGTASLYLCMNTWCLGSGTSLGFCEGASRRACFQQESKADEGFSRTHAGRPCET